MQFRRFSAGPKAYGADVPDSAEQIRRQATSKTQSVEAIPNVEFFDKQFDNDFSAPRAGNFEAIERMLTNLAVNHTVQVESKYLD